MMGRFESIWESAAGDGALSPVGLARPDSEFDALMDAWFKERQDCIESRLYLDEAGRLLRQIVGKDQVPPRLRRQVRELLRALRDFRAADHDNPSEFRED